MVDPVDRYQIYTARDDLKNLSEVLAHAATVPGHVRIVSITWQPTRKDREGREMPGGYTIISEVGE